MRPSTLTADPMLEGTKTSVLCLWAYRWHLFPVLGAITGRCKGNGTPGCPLPAAVGAEIHRASGVEDQEVPNICEEGHHFVTELLLFSCPSFLGSPVAKSSAACPPGPGGMTHSLRSCRPLPDSAGDAARPCSFPLVSAGWASQRACNLSHKGP